MTETPVKIKPKDRPHYVSNPVLYKAFVEWYGAIETAKLEDKPEPPIPPYIAESLYKICTRLAYSPNFFNYSYREDMIGDAIVNVIKSVKNFNIEKGDNPFSFFTTIAKHAFIRRIKEEKSEAAIKGDLLRDLPMEDLFDVSDTSDESLQMQNQYLEFLREHSYHPHGKDEDVSQSIDHPGALDEFMEDEEELLFVGNTDE